MEPQKKHIRSLAGTCACIAGGNALLLEGAKAIRDSEDIFPEYRAALRRRPTLSDPAAGAPARETAPSQALSDPGAQVSPQAAAVWQALLSEPLSVAQLEDRTGMPASRLLGLLTELELEGLAESLPGKRYRRSP